MIYPSALVALLIAGIARAEPLPQGLVRSLLDKPSTGPPVPNWGLLPCNDAEYKEYLTYSAVFPGKAFCGEEYCAGEVHWSTKLKQDDATCFRVGANVDQNSDCYVKEEAQISGKNTFSNNAKGDFPNTSNLGAQFSYVGIGPQNLAGTSTITTDTDRIGLRKADNGIGYDMYAWTLSVIQPDDDYITDAKAGKYGAALKTAADAGYIQKDIQYCAGVFRSWRDPDPQNDQSCQGPKETDPAIFSCRSSDDYLSPSCYNGFTKEICKKMRVAIWILAKSADGSVKYRIPFWDTEFTGETDLVLQNNGNPIGYAFPPGKTPVSSIGDHLCREPQLIVDPQGGASPINIQPNKFAKCPSPGLASPPPPPTPSPPPPTVAASSPPPPPPAVCPPCPACRRRALIAALTDDLSPNQSDNALTASLTFEGACKSMTYINQLELADSVVKTASDVLKRPAIVTEASCRSGSTDLVVEVAALYGQNKPTTEAQRLMQNAFKKSSRAALSGALAPLVWDVQNQKIGEEISFVAAAGFEGSKDKSQSQKNAFGGSSGSSVFDRIAAALRK